ncbi:hypothetical protein [Geobacter argillaceus]|uniref:Uncharacterized protein n=1 Tax=Geobacter argillaceus TaxID=345631 RepID=A0A562WUR7_9BACT|nr:hypothetical protein [Geobacter argillaceus]TWJ33409.1 hypothetical protein JN12_00082 [Geobacter argillaceus]
MTAPSHKADINKYGIPCIKHDLWAWFNRDMGTVAWISRELCTLSQHTVAYCVKEGLLTPEQIKRDLVEPSRKMLEHGDASLTDDERERGADMGDFIKAHTIIALDYWFKDMAGSRCRLHCWGKLSSLSNLPCGFDDLAERCKSDPELYDAFKTVLAGVTDGGDTRQDQAEQLT